MIELAIIILIASIIIAEGFGNSIIAAFIVPISVSYLFYTISLEISSANFSMIFSALSVVALITPIFIILIIYINKIMKA